MTSIPSALTQLRAGKLRALAITGVERDPLLPNVPTLRESGLDVVGGTWVALFAPAATPRPIIDRLSKELSTILKMPDLQAKMNSEGYTTRNLGMTAAEFDDFFTGYLAKWTKIGKGLNLNSQDGARK
jgi:tripartite-type tricarboxylate transporter receptor subunit TctC